MAEGRTSVGQYEELANRLHSAAIHLLRAVSRVDAESGLSPARLSALSVIVVRGPLTMTELAGIERVSPATITSTVTGLEASGLATRARSGSDARQVTVSATVAGRKLLHASRLRRLAVLEGYVETMTPAERAATTDLVAAIERITDTRALTDAGD
ncbi:MAG TPA: MarR family transcriptional regulator [Micromonosporaceae bacterium]|nr:MarR family transcriptional regulator [Micromonosporaceae bacterium]